MLLWRTWKVAREQSPKSLNKVERWHRVFHGPTRAGNRCHDDEGNICWLRGNYLLRNRIEDHDGIVV